MNEMVILVDKHDNQLGLMEKIEAHKKAVLHRAFSVFILNDNNELLIQQRALSKYHSPALWTNTCCSHPRDGESVLDAGARRLKEEMGFETKLDSLLSFVYRAKFDNGLTEHEFDHVLFGYYNDDPSINKLEVMDLNELHKVLYAPLFLLSSNKARWNSKRWCRFGNLGSV